VQLAAVLVDPSRGAFAHAAVMAAPYDEQARIAHAARLGLPFRDAMRYAQYPHRALSLFETVERAVALARDREAATGLSFDLVIVTRARVRTRSDLFARGRARRRLPRSASRRSVAPLPCTAPRSDDRQSAVP